jgi:hypothetical protein
MPVVDAHIFIGVFRNGYVARLGIKSDKPIWALPYRQEAIP